MPVRQNYLVLLPPSGESIKWMIIGYFGDLTSSIKYRVALNQHSHLDVCCRISTADSDLFVLQRPTTPAQLIRKEVVKHSLSGDGWPLVQVWWRAAWCSQRCRRSHRALFWSLCCMTHQHQPCVCPPLSVRHRTTSQLVRQADIVITSSIDCSSRRIMSRGSERRGRGEDQAWTRTKSVWWDGESPRIENSAPTKLFKYFTVGRFHEYTNVRALVLWRLKV